MKAECLFCMEHYSVMCDCLCVYPSRADLQSGVLFIWEVITLQKKVTKVRTCLSKLQIVITFSFSLLFIYFVFMFVTLKVFSIVVILLLSKIFDTWYNSLLIPLALYLIDLLSVEPYLQKPIRRRVTYTHASYILTYIKSITTSIKQHSKNYSLFWSL